MLGIEMKEGTRTLCSRSIALRGGPLSTAILTAQRRSYVVVGNCRIEVGGGPRAGGDLGYPSAAQMLSGWSPIAWQHQAELSDILECADASGRLVEATAILSKDFRELGASPV